MSPEPVDAATFSKVITPLVQRSDPRARVEVSEQGFLTDVLIVRISFDEKSEQLPSLAIKERGPSAGYRGLRRRPLNLLVSSEVAQASLRSPVHLLVALDRAFVAGMQEPRALTFWLLSTRGLDKVEVGSGIVGMSDAFVDDLADRLAIEEGRLSFDNWLSGRVRRDDL